MARVITYSKGRHMIMVLDSDHEPYTPEWWQEFLAEEDRVFEEKWGMSIDEMVAEKWPES